MTTKYRRVYAYAIFVAGQKRIGGTVTAENMDDAVREVMNRERRLGPLTPVYKAPAFRPCDGVMVPQGHWEFEGKRAEVCVWAPAEYFCEVPS